MANKKVLLVDDDAVFVDAVSAVFESAYRVETAGNGTEALEKIRAEPPDIVVLDVMMDHLSEGFDVARTLRTNSETEKIPIIMLTGVDQVYDMRMETDATWVPCDKYLEKPVSPKDLLAIVEEMLG
jgi:two-component system alkaline phosphatase synthesis response regulator PhoP